MFDKVPPSILMVDDNIPAVEMLERLFTGNGFRVYKAFSGHEAITQAALTLPDLILLDVMMPGMSGYETLSLMRQDPRIADIPTIFITAKDAPADIEQGLGLGAVDYIPKPAEPRELLARSRSKIEAKRLRDKLNKRTRDLETMIRISAALNANLRVRDVLAVVTEQTLELTSLGRVIIHYHNAHTTYAEQRETNQQTAISTTLMQSLEQRLNHHLQSASWCYEPQLWGYAHSVIVALHNDSTICGLLITSSNDDTYEDNILLSENVAQQASLALKNANLFELQLNYASELEKTVAKRTEELVAAQRLLIRSEKLASVGRLASAIAHEINNPLTPVVLNLELMVEDIQSGKPINTNDVDILATYRSAQRIKRIVERVLQFTRKGREDEPAMDRVNVGNLLQSLVALSKHFFEQANVRLDLHISTNLPDVLGNPDQLEQVFLNVMLNAKDAMIIGGMLTITASPTDGHVVISFEDNGRGIEPVMMEKIFEPFASTKGSNGSGLGLFVSYEIILNHHGTIEVASEVGVGTRFIITLPANH